jgi:hypothetical protein
LHFSFLHPGNQAGSLSSFLQGFIQQAIHFPLKSHKLNDPSFQ